MIKELLRRSRERRLRKVQYRIEGLKFFLDRQPENLGGNASVHERYAQIADAYHYFVLKEAMLKDALGYPLDNIFHP